MLKIDIVYNIYLDDLLLGGIIKDIIYDSANREIINSENEYIDRLYFPTELPKGIKTENNNIYYKRVVSGYLHFYFNSYTILSSNSFYSTFYLDNKIIVNTDYMVGDIITENTVVVSNGFHYYKYIIYGYETSLILNLLITSNFYDYYISYYRKPEEYLTYLHFDKNIYTFKKDSNIVIKFKFNTGIAKSCISLNELPDGLFLNTTQLSGIINQYINVSIKIICSNGISTSNIAEAYLIITGIINNL